MSLDKNHSDSAKFVKTVVVCRTFHKVISFQFSVVTVVSGRQGGGEEAHLADEEKK